MKTDNSKNQLRWVILLLATAVILPTVCLLYFMTQAVKNERLAVRQKLIDVCNDNIKAFRADLNSKYTAAKNDDIKRMTHLVGKDDILLWINAIRGNAEGLVVYDADNELVYPIIGEYQSSDFSSEMQQAVKLEQNGEYQPALEKYQKIMDANDAMIFHASMGIIRCLEKMDMTVETADFFHKILWSDEQKIRTQFTADQVAMIRVKKVQWLSQHKDTFTSGNMFGDLAAWYHPPEIYPSEVTIWALERILEIARDYGEGYKLESPIKNAEEIINTERISLACAEFFNNNESLRNWPHGKWKTLKTSQVFYAVRYVVDDQDILLIKSTENILSTFAADIKNIAIDGIGIRLLDDTDKLIYGTGQAKNTSFITTDLSDHFPGWKLQLYFENGSVFDNAAGRQTTIYTWTGMLVTLFILCVGVFAGLAVEKQIRLNTLKNDFIATVTHELKTPLASMRVLVDTLLEGNYNDQEQATEYLQLISKENKRLTGLIDNFLTFSRMERNKQTFEIIPTSPAEIAKDAAHALKTKFAQGNCDFTTNIPGNLPEIRADHDAMVTVLINLLDNAYKYSGDNKQIDLTLYQHETHIYFKVKDNGKGMSPRITRKIFERFYQADSRLSRSAEGCGLGLSIVKFIVDAHKGTIEVQSKLNKGSEFTVIIPIRPGLNQTGDHKINLRRLNFMTILRSISFIRD